MADYLTNRDIKTTNVLLDSNWRAKLCDFSFAIHVESMVRSEYIYGTDEFMAPEVALGELFDCQADIFSFGVLLAEVITEREPDKHFLHRKAQTLFSLDVDELHSVRLLHACVSDTAQIMMHAGGA